MLTITATSSVATGARTVDTLYTNSTMPGHTFTTFDLTCIHRPSFTTKTQHPIITCRLYQGIWL